MTPRMRSLSLCAAVCILVGCTTGDPAPAARTSDSTASDPASMQHAVERAFYWREEARELHEMAERRERAADLLARSDQGSATNEAVARMRTLAKQLHAAAYADEQAEEAQRQVPEGRAH